MAGEGLSDDVVRWLIQQGGFAVVLLLVAWDYKRTILRMSKEQQERDQQMNDKLEGDKGVLLEVVKENTGSNIELKAVVERWVRVTEESFPRIRGGPHER